MRTATRLRAADTMREGSLKAYTDRIAAEIRTDRGRKAQNRNVRLRGIDPIRLRTGLMRRNLPITPIMQNLKNRIAAQETGIVLIQACLMLRLHPYRL